MWQEAKIRRAAPIHALPPTVTEVIDHLCPDVFSFTDDHCIGVSRSFVRHDRNMGAANDYPPSAATELGG
jgi:hypothetical protein